MQEKKELNWVNVAKAISIITVLFVHTENYYGLEFGEINQFLCGFYVNAFFLISGYCKIFYPQASLWGLFLIFGLTLIGAYIASLVIVKYLPWMLDIRKLRK